MAAKSKPSRTSWYASRSALQALHVRKWISRSPDLLRIQGAQRISRHILAKSLVLHCHRVDLYSNVRRERLPRINPDLIRSTDDEDLPWRRACASLRFPTASRVQRRCRSGSVPGSRPYRCSRCSSGNSSTAKRRLCQRASPPCWLWSASVRHRSSRISRIRQRRAPPFQAQAVQCGAARDGQQPHPERASLRNIQPCPPPELDKRVLRGLFGQHGLPQDVNRESMHA